MRPIRSVSVLMPTWQGMEFLERVLDALARQRFDRPWDFLAIDSGSSDGTWELLGARAEKFPVPLRRERIDQVEFDHGDTRNLLAVRSRGDLLVFLTQDAIPSDERWLQKLVANFDDARVAAAYCRNVPRPDARISTKIASAGDPGYASGRREVRLPDAQTYALQSAHEKRLLYNFNDVASAVRRELWELHPFPRTWFGEDLLMSRALLEAGYTVVYDDEATVEHSHDYNAEEMHARAKIDGRFNAEWLDRICIASKSDARVMTERVLEQDRTALHALALSDEQYGAELEAMASLRAAAFEGLYEGGLEKRRRPGTRMLERPKLRILYVVHGFMPDAWAGTEVYTQNLAKEMQRRGHEVVILARTGAAQAEEQGGPKELSLFEGEFDGLRVVRLVHRLNHLSLRHAYSHPGVDDAFRLVLEREQPDIVHFQHFLHLSVGMVGVAQEYDLPTLVTCHDYWSICARVQLIRPDGVRCEENMGSGCLLCIRDEGLRSIPRMKRLDHAAKPLLDALASGARWSRRAGATGALGKRWEGYGDLRARQEVVTGAFRACDLQVSPSRFLRRKLIDTADFDAHALLYSENGMRVDHVRALEKRPDPAARVRFGFVGSLVWYKGGEVMLRAMARLAGTRAVLNVFGEFKPELDEHHRALQQLAGDNVVFRGRFDNARLSEVYAEIDVLIVPSLWFENAPITIREAFLTRTPVVASDIGGMRESVREGVDGLLFQTGDDASLAACLRRFVDEPGLLAALSRDFPPVKTIAEDAAAMEFRYRGLCCIQRGAGATGRGERVLLERKATETIARAGGTEQQGAAYLLLRSGSGAAAEYDIFGAGGGQRIVRVEQFALGAEKKLGLGLRASVDGVPLGEFPLFTSDGADTTRAHDFKLALPKDAKRLRLEPLKLFLGRESHARIASVRIIRPALRAAASKAALGWGA